jgi:cytochrome c-type biogenesis protein CcmH/NrfG
MALSMEEQRILAEIEQNLARAEPALAARLAAFGRPGSAARALRSPRVRIMVSVVVLVVVTVVSLVMYALLPLRATPDRGSAGRATSAPRHPAMSAPRGPVGRGPGLFPAGQPSLAVPAR